MPAVRLVSRGRDLLALGKKQARRLQRPAFMQKHFRADGSGVFADVIHGAKGRIRHKKIAKDKNKMRRTPGCCFDDIPHSPKSVYLSKDN